MLSVNQAISTSQVGGYVRTRLDQIVAQVKAELAPEDTGINNDAKALEGQRASLDAATYQSRGNALGTRVNALRQKADLRNREVKATEDKALNRIAQETGADRLEPLSAASLQRVARQGLGDDGQSGHGSDRRGRDGAERETYPVHLRSRAPRHRGPYGRSLIDRDG